MNNPIQALSGSNNKCHTCSAIYSDYDVKRPPECVGHITPLDCAFNATQMDKGRTLGEAMSIDPRHG